MEANTMVGHRLGQFYEGFSSWRRALARATLEDQPVVFANCVREAIGWVEEKGLDKTDCMDELTDIAASILMDVDYAQHLIAREVIRRSVERQGYELPASYLKELADTGQSPGDYLQALADESSSMLEDNVVALRPEQTNKQQTNGQDQTTPLVWLDMSRWDDEPRPEREWAILNRVPLCQPGLFSGEGGAGKSIIEMMRDVAHVAGKDWLGSLPEPGAAFYIGAEDGEKELHIRLYDIVKHYGVTFKEVIAGGLRVLCMLGKDATLCAAKGKSGTVETTALYRQLYEQAGDLKPKNISIDTLTRAFAGNELDRVQVYGYAMRMQALAMVANGSVTTLSHPSLQGIASGSGLSGSTAWHGAFRYRQFLHGVKVKEGEDELAGDLRELEFLKNQYGPKAETITLHYRGGLFLQVPSAGSLEQVAAAAKADDAFLDLLNRFASQGRTVGAAPTSNNYAPSLFAKENCGLKYKQLDAAMRRLFTAGKIKVESYGRPSRPQQRLIRVEPPQ